MGSHKPFAALYRNTRMNHVGIIFEANQEFGKVPHTAMNQRTHRHNLHHAVYMPGQ